MITIRAKQLNSVLRELRRVLGIRKRISFQPVTFVAASGCLKICSRTEDIAVSNQIDGGFDDTEFSLSLHDLSLFARARGDIRLDRTGDQVNVTWQDSLGTHSRMLQSFGAPVYDDSPRVLYSNDATLAQALKHAAHTTDSQSLRYSIGCVRLRSSDGQVAATDGRQAFVHSGFSLPAGELLVPAAALKCFSLWGKADSVAVGLRDDWVCFHVEVGNARWCLEIKRLLVGRFPDLDRCIPHPRSARSTLTIDDGDAKLLIEHLERLSSDPDQHGPITLDLGKSPVIRYKARNHRWGRSPDTATGRSAGHEYSSDHDREARVVEVENRHGSKVTELALTASQHSGPPIRCATNHRHVLAALRYGFRNLNFQGPEFPAFSHLGAKAFAWTICQSSFVIPPGRCDEQRSAQERVPAMS